MARILQPIFLDQGEFNMAFNLVINASSETAGNVPPKTFYDFPEDLQEAMKSFTDEEIYAGFVRSFTIAQQQKMRAEYKAPLTGSRTKRGSALAQAAAAREKRMRELSNMAENKRIAEAVINTQS
jgi:hypothetical protein